MGCCCSTTIMPPEELVGVWMANVGGSTSGFRLVRHAVGKIAIAGASPVCRGDANTILQIRSDAFFLKYVKWGHGKHQGAYSVGVKHYDGHDGNYVLPIDCCCSCWCCNTSLEVGDPQSADGKPWQTGSLEPIHSIVVRGERLYRAQNVVL